MVVADWISLANLITAAIAVAVTAFVTYHVAKRSGLKRLSIFEGKTVVLAKAATIGSLDIDIRVASHVVRQLNSQRFTIFNSGPNPVENVEFVVRSNRDHSLFYSAGEDSFRGRMDQVLYDPKQVAPSYLIFKFDFLNPKESFGFDVVYDGDEEKLEADARMPGVELRRFQQSDIDALTEEIANAFPGGGYFRLLNKARKLARGNGL